MCTQEFGFLSLQSPANEGPLASPEVTWQGVCVPVSASGTKRDSIWQQHTAMHTHAAACVCHWGAHSFRVGEVPRLLSSWATSEERVRGCETLFGRLRRPLFQRCLFSKEAFLSMYHRRQGCGWVGVHVGRPVSAATVLSRLWCAAGMQQRCVLRLRLLGAHSAVQARCAHVHGLGAALALDGEGSHCAWRLGRCWAWGPGVWCAGWQACRVCHLTRVCRCTVLPDVCLCVCVCFGAAMCLVPGHRRVMMASGVHVCLKGPGGTPVGQYSAPRAHRVQYCRLLVTGEG